MAFGWAWFFGSRLCGYIFMAYFAAFLWSLLPFCVSNFQLHFGGTNLNTNIVVVVAPHSFPHMIIHYTSFKILKGKREKRKRQERTKNGEGKYKETTLTQLYLMQIASDFSFKIFSFSFLFPVCLEWCFLCGKGKIFCMWGDTGFPFAHLLLIFSCLKRSKTFRNIYDMQCWFLTESKSACGSHKGILNTNKILYTENDA